MIMNAPVEIGGGEGGRGAAGGAGAGALGFVSGNERLVLLHSRLKRIAKARAHLDAQEAEALREAQQLQLWKQFGHVSLVDYMVQELGYSSFRVAEDRLRLANALPELPKLTEALKSGEINVSQAREIARVATAETEEKWIEKALDLNVRETEQAVAGHCKGDLPEDPVDPRLVRKTLWLSVRPETEVLFREVRKQLDQERGEKLDEDAVLDALCRTYLHRTERRDGKRTDHATHVGANAGQSSDPDRDHDQDRASSSGDQDQEQSSSSTQVVGANAGQDSDRDRDPDQDRGDQDQERPSSSTHVGANAGQNSEHDCDQDRASSSADQDQHRSSSSIRVGATDQDSDDAREHMASYSGCAPYRIAVTVCSDCKRGWQHGGGAVEEMTPPAVEAAMCDGQWIGDINSRLVERARQDISPATRRKVLHRDQGRCRVPGCHAHRNLDIHHILHVVNGGTNELLNMLTLCEAHHLAHHAGTLVIERVGEEVTFRREGRNRFTRATREVETKEALRGRGLDRDQVKAIMTRTVTHVGDNDISAGQWIAIALRYAAELAPQ